MHCTNALHWLHQGLATGAVTFCGVAAKRGRAARERVAILRRFTGQVHDHQASYFEFSCAQVLCNAHHQRERLHIAESYRERWAVEQQTLSAAQPRRYARRYDRMVAGGWR